VQSSQRITTTNGIAVDFNQPNVMTATTAVRAGLPPGSLDSIEDFIGVVTAASSSSITVQSKITGNSMTATIPSNTEFDLAPVTYSKCLGTSASCIAIGSTVSLDADLSSSGILTASERLQNCGLELHPEETKIVYCKHDDRRRTYPTGPSTSASLRIGLLQSSIITKRKAFAHKGSL
jgi:hypothetical protein